MSENGATVMDIGDPAVMIDRILTLGGIRVGEHTHTVRVFHIRPGRWAELTTDHQGQTRLSLSEAMDAATHTVTAVIDSPAFGHAVMTALGYTHTSHCAGTRTTFHLATTTVYLDRWPAIPAVLHLTDDNVHDLLTTCVLLGHPQTRLTPLTVTEVYQHARIRLTDHDRVSVTATARRRPRETAARGRRHERWWR